MRKTTMVRAAAMVALVGVAASIADAFFDREFPARIRADAVLMAVGPAVGPGQRGPRIRQKIRIETEGGTVRLFRGDQSEPPALAFFGDFDVTRSTPRLEVVRRLQQLGVAVPMPKVNSSETKGSLKAGDEVYSQFRPALEELLSRLATADANPDKVTSDFLGGDLGTSTLKQKGKVKVDTRTFTKLKSKILIKGNAFVEDGPYSGYDVKYKLKITIKPGRG